MVGSLSDFVWAEPSSRCTAKKTKDEGLELLTNDLLLLLLGHYEHMDEEREHLLYVITEVKVNT